MYGTTRSKNNVGIWSLQLMLVLGFFLMTRLVYLSLFKFLPNTIMLITLFSLE
uniref:Uncharacterized protein n=1 Tax=Meloidogyne enterolobii TaxID=390850 RepID=A0A6V7WJS2_MELEN|nr:unnamed protein product [Meloidogyne enterolobii]